MTHPDSSLDALLAVLRGHPPPNTLFSWLKPHQKHSHPHTANHTLGGLGPRHTLGCQLSSPRPLRGTPGAQDTPPQPVSPITNEYLSVALTCRYRQRRWWERHAGLLCKQGVVGSNPIIKLLEFPLLQAFEVFPTSLHILPPNPRYPHTWKASVIISLSTK